MFCYAPNLPHSMSHISWHDPITSQVVNLLISLTCQYIPSISLTSTCKVSHWHRLPFDIWYHVSNRSWTDNRSNHRSSSINVMGNLATSNVAINVAAPHCAHHPPQQAHYSTHSAPFPFAFFLVDNTYTYMYIVSLNNKFRFYTHFWAYNKHPPLMRRGGVSFLHWGTLLHVHGYIIIFRAMYMSGNCAVWGRKGGKREMWESDQRG